MSTSVPVKWQEPIGSLRDRVMRAFDKWLPSRAANSASMPEPVDESGFFWPEALWSFGGPAVDVSETDDAIMVAAELPGLSEKDFSVELSGNRLLLKGEKKGSREEKREGRYYSEMSYGSFYRAIPLPAEIDANRVEANYKHGVLHVTLPKTEAAKSRRVSVRVN